MFHSLVGVTMPRRHSRGVNHATQSNDLTNPFTQSHCMHASCRVNTHKDKKLSIVISTYHSK